MKKLCDFHKAFFIKKIFFTFGDFFENNIKK
jgi:hypothetical protein